MHRYVLGRLFGVSSIRGFYIHSVYSAGGKIYLATFIEKMGFHGQSIGFYPCIMVFDGHDMEAIFIYDSIDLPIHHDLVIARDYIYIAMDSNIYMY